MDSIYMKGNHRSRRSVLASIGGCISIGLAGCSGSGGDDNGGGAGGDDSPERTSETTGTQEWEQPDSIIPGEVVHNENEAARILGHWAKDDGFIMMRIRNTGNKKLQIENLGGDTIPLLIAARTLTAEGSVVALKQAGSTSRGPNVIEPGAEETIGVLAEADESNVARYELCFKQKFGTVVGKWQECCG